MDLAAKEATFIFLTFARSQSFQSTDFTSTVIWNLFEPKFAWAQREVGAYVGNVLAPLSVNQIKE
jgi:hypothetical protein